MFSVILADDEKIMRSALALVLRQKLSIQNLSEAANMDELLLRTCEADTGLILLDWELPGLAALRRLHPGLKVVALSARPEARETALAAGVDAFLTTPHAKRQGVLVNHHAFDNRCSGIEALHDLAPALQTNCSDAFRR